MRQSYFAKQAADLISRQRISFCGYPVFLRYADGCVFPVMVGLPDHNFTIFVPAKLSQPQQIQYIDMVLGRVEQIIKCVLWRGELNFERTEETE